jgi:hypothetical protein
MTVKFRWVGFPCLIFSLFDGIVAVNAALEGDFGGMV